MINLNSKTNIYLPKTKPFISIPSEAFKIHRTSAQTSVTTNTWTDCDTFTEILDETLGGIAELNENNKTIDILKDGFYLFGGCLHCQNNTGTRFEGIVVLLRLLKNNGEATEEELRCSQRGFVKDIGAVGEDILSYNGTVSLSAGDTVNLQYWTDEADLEFNSNSNFDTSVAYTCWLIRLGSI